MGFIPVLGGFFSRKLCPALTPSVPQKQYSVSTRQHGNLELCPPPVLDVVQWQPLMPVPLPNHHKEGEVAAAKPRHLLPWRPVPPSSSSSRRNTSRPGHEFIRAR